MKNARRKNTPLKAAVLETSATDPLAALFREAVSEATVRLLETAPQKVPLHDLYAVSNVLNLDPGIVLGLLHSAIR